LIPLRSDQTTRHQTSKSGFKKIREIKDYWPPLPLSEQYKLSWLVVEVKRSIAWLGFTGFMMKICLLTPAVESTETESVTGGQEIAGAGRADCHNHKIRQTTPD